MIKTLSDAVTLVEFIVARQGKSIDEAILEAGVPLHLQEHVLRYFAPPLAITAPNLISDSVQKLPRCNPDIDSMQQYFGAYQRFLIDSPTRRWPKSSVGTLAETSLDLVRQLPKPDSADSFKVYGLVLGYIQSGKTANMSALISRAADEGYKLFIVLGGLWKDLRAQTQRRFDQEITGRSDDPGEECVLHDPNIAAWGRLTRSGLDGDFVNMPNNLDSKAPHLAVIKKNKRIEGIMEWLERSPGPLKDLPAIIIDDEADQGSINTNYGRVDDDGCNIDPSTTNRRIRELIQKLPKCAYIGFTATPFANVLIDAEEDDLYPRDFIATLPEPPGYFGPRKLFGLGMDPSDLSPNAKHDSPLDVIRKVKDDQLDEIDEVLENGGNCPALLSEALLAYVLSCCARLSRGHENGHFSMLIHPSQKTGPHRIVANVIKEELELIKAAATRPKKFPDLLKRAKEMWESDFCRVTKEQEEFEEGEYELDFEKIWKFAKSITDAVEIKVLNTYSDDILDYSGYPKRYIVIGGNRLSRGLTLEGLSVSVFTRMANNYDTLLQMGRWFGYRPKYSDLTRIYVGREMADRFAELARVEDELRADLKKYAQEPDPPTPLQLKPIVRAHPTMAVTSRMKMGAGKPISISFQKTTAQTVSFPVKNRGLLRKNLDSSRAFVSKLGNAWHSASDEGMHIWKDLPSAAVIEFLNEYEFSREAMDVNRQNLVNYIKRQNDKGELITWDFSLPSGNPKLDPFSWTGKYITRKVIRTPMTSQSIKVLSSTMDIDYCCEITNSDKKDSSRGRLFLYLIDKKSGSEKGKSFFPDEDTAEDILGLVLDFPGSNSNATIEYISQ